MELNCATGATTFFLSLYRRCAFLLLSASAWRFLRAPACEQTALYFHLWLLKLSGSQG